MEKVSFLNQPNCYRLSNGTIDVIVTTDVGPRVVRYGFVNEENALGEVPDASVTTEFGEWKPWGGHRLWVAPEAKPRSYVPDNGSIEFEADDDHTIRLRPSIESPTGMQKEMTVTLDAAGTGVTVHHRIINRGLWGVRVAPWAITIMNGGGETILPQEPYRSWDETVLPARPLVLWHYTDLRDPRWSIGKKLIRLRTDANLDQPQKIGILNKQGWAAYLRRDTLFIKSVDYEESAMYPDYGSNAETYTAGSFMEIETLAPLRQLEPGDAATHIERWHLFSGVPAGADEDALLAALAAPLIAASR